MSTKKVLLLNPYDSETIKEIALLGKAYNSDDSGVIDFINKARQLDPENYSDTKKNSNEIEEVMYLQEDNNIKDYCHIYGEKDRKIGTITFPITGLKRKSFLSMLINCTQDLGLKSLFVKTTSEDKSLIKDLESLNFESLGEENGTVIYLQEELEKDDRERGQRMI